MLGYFFTLLLHTANKNFSSTNCRLRNSHDDARETFKTLKSQQIGEEYAIMYAEWAGLEAMGGSASKALSIVSKGIKAGAEPRG